MKGLELRRLRRQLKLTQAAFAAELGVHPNSEARMERNEQPIRPPIAKLARLVAKTTRPRRSAGKARR